MLFTHASLCTRAQGRVYGIGWGHRDLEYRRTVVTVHEINDEGISFCVMGLRSHKNGYYVHLSVSDTVAKAICLSDWVTQHPEDAKP